MPVGAGASRKAAEPRGSAAAAAAIASDRDQTRARRRRRIAKHEHADEFMKVGVGVDPDWQVPDDAAVVAADRGAGPLGFAGNAPKAQVAATGMARLAGSAFGGPKEPMMPSGWREADTDPQ